MRTTAREREQMKAQMCASSALLLLAAARGALAAPCAFQDCSAYCAGRCPYRPNISSSGVDSLKVWRMTPWNVTDMDEHDTGDARGDMGFLMEKYIAASSCKPPYVTRECFLGDRTVVGEFAVEFDAAYGPYLKCNPTNAEGSHEYLNMSKWLCAYGHPGPSAWAPVPNSCAGCPRANVSVGKDPAHHVWNTSKFAKMQMSSYFGGYWYSTPAKGKCGAGQKPGDGSGCTWRTTAAPKFVNASCVATQLFAVLKQHNPSCFAACTNSGQRGDPCFARCVTETVLGGRHSASGAGIPVPPMVAAWEASFKGACPFVDTAALSDAGADTA